MINYLKNLVSNKDNDNTTNDNTNSNHVVSVRNWYEEKFDTIIVQRNFLILLVVILMISIVSALGVVIYVVNSKKFDPFVIQIDDETGRAKIVNPTTSTILNGNEALAKYFIKKYVKSRETYNPVDYKISRKIVGLLSERGIFIDYLQKQRDKEISPSLLYGQANTTYMKIKSWSKLDGNKYLLRFSLNETRGSKAVFHKLAVVEFAYIAMELNEAQRDINPVGFQIKGYRVDDDNS